ncbi:unnamed protein product [Anisakis simplex]|uniref:Hexosyltransferase n=1 Tax=Anisakis simplex TaxID=6269 RepID=A0A0M3K9C2_ANISI|nr:unnamed protein product [Anisakis simplex]
MLNNCKWNRDGPEQLKLRTFEFCAGPDDSRLKIPRNITKTELNDSQSGVYITNHTFEWNVIEKDFCSVRYPNVKMLIVVHTAISHLATRQTYREMYGDRFYEQMGVVTLFFLGMPSDDKEQLQIHNESQTYHDIIQQDFLDTYRNLTWKAISWLQYVNEFCEKVEFILKVDDDLVFDLIAIEKYLRRKSPLSDDANVNANLILCHVFSGVQHYPVRDEGAKWYVSREEYEPDFYYPYCRGILYLMSRRTAVNLLKASIGEKYFWIDDYFITGHLGHKIGVVFDNIALFDAGEEPMMEGRSWLTESQDMTEAMNLWKNLEEAHRNASNSIVLWL